MSSAYSDAGRPRGRSALCVLALCCVALAAALRAGAAEPPRFKVPSEDDAPLVLVVYGDTRFTHRSHVVNAIARRALVERIATEKPAAILIGGDLVYEGRDPGDYQTFRSETMAWSTAHIPVFPALGNHELRGCKAADVQPCLENWWSTFDDLPLRPHRWYSVAIGSNMLALVLDSGAPLKPGSEQRSWFEAQIAGADDGVKFILIVLHYPPVRDPFFPRGLDEKEVARYLARHAASLRAKVLVVGSHVHNYERYFRDGVNYVVSGGGGAKAVPAPRMFGEESHLRTAVNFHYLRLTLEKERLAVSMVRYDAGKVEGPQVWSEPDRFEIRARD
ncbi:MAG TPA: metallophosphoesterase [Steroidobacteraceae bacterium]|nr:metallophosphoesterase [Steroidobacteraceae bacterium]